MERRFYIETYGCQMNVADSELMLGQLGRAGYRRVERAEEADVILVNTCAIREHAEQRIYGRLGELTRHKLRRPGVVLGVAGCMAQHLRGKLMERVPQVDLVVGPDGYRRLPELIDEAREEPTLAVRLSRVETYGDLVPARADGVRAWVSIMRGCDKFCTFCIVPYVRGRERSLPADEVLRQVEHAAAEGFREVVFLGQTVNAYRDGDVDFAELLIRADRVPGIARIRFTSPHPSDMTDRAIDAMARCEKVPPHLHLPLQSGSDAVLSRMRRIYSIDEYERLVERIRRAIPGIALSTDIIVGFPGETEEDFETTRRAMDRIGYESAFIFKYSPRPGARSAEWPETVDEEEKTRRITLLIEEQKERSLLKNESDIGSIVEVLVEGPTKRNPSEWFGKSAQFKTTVFPHRGARVGEVVPVRVAAATPHALLGEGVRAATFATVEDVLT
ncbi:MAG: tRNA (N6-isopentenyl adenosine(37)-C2)-methylthiotransferase MiaB [Candidatus Eisenbacteria bacterium]|uniref:tRNA-2-methylthio-N(6)-dimethylallyladenosine synthase n=1 Tax=Eiseniibacteriota bacterium TaxID=2212470 RepID=A0A538S9X3_UNCEI|nr:MAG: tRNA (N6-isopentenyl adenosine(37)-C2)-methylthiotransferase MiaB [Candidatus Eisenbacteria bacterium]